MLLSGLKEPDGNYGGRSSESKSSLKLPLSFSAHLPTDGVQLRVGIFNSLPERKHHTPTPESSEKLLRNVWTSKLQQEYTQQMTRKLHG